MAYSAGASSGNLVLISKQSASNSASLVFTSGITAYDVLYLQYYNVVIQTNAQFVFVRLSTNGGASYSNAGYNTEGFFSYSGSISTGSRGAQTGIVIGDSESNSTSLSLNGSCTLYNFANTALNKNGIASFAGEHGSLGQYLAQYNTRWATTTAVNAIQVIAASGNLVSGTFKLYGIAN